MENNTRKGMISLTKKHGGVSEEHNDYSELNMQLQQLKRSLKNKLKLIFKQLNKNTIRKLQSEVSSIQEK